MFYNFLEKRRDRKDIETHNKGENMSNNTYPITCKECKRKFDLKEAANKSDDRNDRNIRCPYCKAVIGSKNN